MSGALVVLGRRPFCGGLQKAREEDRSQQADQRAGRQRLPE